MSPALHGVDFSSRPGPRKPIMVASGELDGTLFTLRSLTELASLDAFAAWLAEPGPWLTGFDFPFSLSREFVEGSGWPARWPELMQHLRRHSRAELRGIFQAWCDARPSGSKFAHRAADLLAGASPSMKWVNPPVAWMLLEGAPRLLDAGVDLPGLHRGDPLRVALEAYPGVVARRITRASYKSDDRARQTPARREARQHILHALQQGMPLGIALYAAPALCSRLLDDASGDALDATICAMQAAWGWQRRASGYGLPADADPLEGWIVSVEAPGSQPG